MSFRHVWAVDYSNIVYIFLGITANQAPSILPMFCEMNYSHEACVSMSTSVIHLNKRASDLKHLTTKQELVNVNLLPEIPFATKHACYKTRKSERKIENQWKACICSIRSI